jgi:hypothetical protein
VVECNQEGFYDNNKIDKETDRGCKVEVKVKLDVKANYWYYDIVSLNTTTR